ncbi:MAG TPA: acyl-CoA dehydrogenase family protein [Mycobacteriales bacterium]|jgi:putative acyl-CoA dehydrogenase|nr:acyl-CoA dehydrogenase family protein [Mycobacteriales bacterium]
MASTHEVTNQPPPLVDHDVYGGDLALTETVRRLGAETAGLRELGRLAGTPEAQRWGTEANASPPVLRTHDRYGHRVDEVDFHPSYHRLLTEAVGHGLAGAPWAEAASTPHTTRAAGFYVWSQVEAGHGCPVSMSYAVLPALRHEPVLAATYEPGLTARAYEPGLRAGKPGLLAGMGMTEKQGGSDVRANRTLAVPRADGSWRLTGHKWFCSAPMSDLFLVLAQVGGAGLTCFLVPRVLPDGERNVFRLQRLKDKLGNRSNASSEVEFEDTVGWAVGAPGQGLRTILEMVRVTRLDCVLGSAALMRAAVAQAVHHTTYRSAFGGVLRDKPLMASVLADLALESEAATVLGLRLAAAVDAGEDDFSRLATAVAKFWVCKRAPMVAAEALECLGGNGYVEESGLPRLFRESPLNSIWEGAGNVIALDVLRALAREPAAVEAVLAEVDAAAGGDARLDAAAKQLRADLAGRPDEAAARLVATRIALALQASLLVRYAPAPVADAFCGTRLGDGPGPVFGLGVPDPGAVVDRAAPVR